MQVLLAAILFLSVQTNVTDSLLIRQTQKQVRDYVNHIRENKNKDINLWALSTVIKARPKIRSYLFEYIHNNQIRQSYSVLFKDTTLNSSSRLKKLAFQARSPFLLTAYILEEPDETQMEAVVQQYDLKIGFPSLGNIEYDQIIQALIHNQKITNAMLPAEQFYPVSYLLFYHTKRSPNNLFSKTYLKNASNSWTFSSAYSLQQAMAIATLFKIYYNFQQDNNAVPIYATILNNTTLPNYPVKLSILRALDYSMYVLGYYHRSIKIMTEHAIPLGHYLKLPDDVIKMEISNASNLYQIGKYNASMQVYSDLLKNAENTSSQQKIKIYNNLAINYYKTGDFDAYLLYIFKSLEVAKLEGITQSQLEILTNLFIYYRKSGDFNSAETYLKKAQQIAQQTTNLKNIAKLTFYEGMLYKEFRSKPDSVLSLFRKALTYLSPQKNYTYYQVINTEMAFIYEKQYKYNKALEQYNGMITRAKERDNIQSILESTIHKANVFLSTGQKDSVKAMLAFLNTQQLNKLSFDHIVKAKTVRAKYLINRGNTEQAYRLLKPALKQVVLRSRASGDLQTGFWQVESEYLSAFEVMANLLINTGQTEEAVEILDQFKTVNATQLYQNPLSRSQVLNAEELSLYKRLIQKLNTLRKDLLAVSKKQHGNIQLQIDKLSAKKKKLDLKITANAAIKHVSVNQIQSHMNSHERVLQFTELNNTYYFAIISRNTAHFKKIPLTDSVRSLFNQAIYNLNRGATNLNQLHKITQLLGLKKIPAYVNSLTMMPDSYLYQLPLAALPLEKPTHSFSYGSTNYLIEHFKINYKTSLSDFISVQQQSKKPLDFVGYAVSKFDKKRNRPLTPLPYVDNEVKNIKKQLTRLENKKLFINDEATKEAFQNFAPKARIVHVATHSMVSNRNPLFSSIFFSSNNKSDNQYSGRIFAYELFELDLNSDLVMLNSCESASGKYLQGSGIVGISRALRYAGVNALMLNLWPVNDKLASEFAVKFYSYLNDGLSKAQSLRKTQLYLLSHTSADPYYWASFMLLGNSDALIYPHKKTNRIVAFSFMALFVSFAFASSYLEWKRKHI